MEQGVVSVVGPSDGLANDISAWGQEIAALMSLVGGVACHVVAFKGGRLRLNGGVGLSGAQLAEYAERVGGDPAQDPRLAPLLPLPATSVIDESAIPPETERRAPGLRQEFIDRLGASRFCAVCLLNTPDAKAFAVVSRGAGQGPLSPQQKAGLGLAQPGIGLALAMQLRLEDNADAVTVSTLEALNVAAFLCDPSGLIIDSTSQALRTLAMRRLFEDRRGRLRALHGAGDKALQAALGRARTEPTTMVILDVDEANAVIVRALALKAKDSPFEASARMLVVVGGPAQDDGQTLRQYFRLTSAEAAVAILLAQGASPGEIAVRRGVSIATIRAQISTVFGKLNVSRAAELAAKLRAFL